MKITDINGKEREVEYCKEIAHEVVDKDGNPVNEQYIEVVIIGHSGRRWKEWYSLKEFLKFNPDYKELIK